MSADVEIIRAPFGGAWACPFTDDGETTLQQFFGEEPAEIPVPLGGEGAFALGYIVEPFQMGDLAEHLRADGATWEIG
jgi:hypothetical protein